MLPGSTAAPNGGAGAAGAGQQAPVRTTKVLLLLNMVAPGCVDNELEAEIRTECQSKYGPVLRVLIYEVRAAVRGVGTSVAVPPDARVRIFVSFAHQDSALKAHADLNGRFFAQRQVRASFFSETKFANLELAP